MTDAPIPQTERFISLITRDTLALVLAGGKGKRLGALTHHRVKPAVPFGGRFRLIDFPLSNCVNSGIRRIGILTQYKAHPLIQHVQQGWNFFRYELGEYIELLPAQQRTGEGWYRGTADAVQQNTDIIRQHDPQFILVLGGDHVYKMDYGALLAAHVGRGADITVGCIPVKREEASGFGVMHIDRNNRVIEFIEKPSDPPGMPDRPDMALASMGIYVFNTRYLLDVLAQDVREPESEHDFGRNVVPEAVPRDKVYAYPFRDMLTGEPAYWRDVGTLDSYWKANIELLGTTPELDFYDHNWPLWTFQPQLPPAKFVFDDENCRGTAISSIVSGGCIVAGAIVRCSVLFSDVRVEPGSRVEQSVVLPGVRIGRNCHVHRAIIDGGCRLPDGFRVGMDPASDAKRFEISEEGITLVSPEMLGQESHVY